MTYPPLPAQSGGGVLATITEGNLVKSLGINKFWNIFEEIEIYYLEYASKIKNHTEFLKIKTNLGMVQKSIANSNGWRTDGGGGSNIKWICLWCKKRNLKDPGSFLKKSSKKYRSQMEKEGSDWIFNIISSTGGKLWTK